MEAVQRGPWCGSPDSQCDYGAWPPLLSRAARTSDRGSTPSGPGGSAGAPHRGGVTALLGPAEIRTLATRLGVHPTKTLGQNFVHDPNTVRRIVRAAELSA